MSKRKTIWIDLENTPHIPFFAPIIREVESRGHRVVLTARDAYQTCEMADLYRLNYRRIGRHFGKRRLFKALGLALRTSQLLAFALRTRPDLAISHGSRSQIVTAYLLRMPSLMMDDYEHSHGVGFGHPTWTLLPEALAHTTMGGVRTKRLFYPGIKEDVYAHEHRFESGLLERLGVPRGQIVVTVRPPATEAHYHNPEAEVFFARFMARAVANPETTVVLLPRNRRQEIQIRTRWPEWFAQRRALIPPGVVDGLSLLAASDLVVSGGGTMNREAAALGIPVYSIFRGTIGAVDRALCDQGRLVLIDSPEAVDGRIQLVRRQHSSFENHPGRRALGEIVAHIETILSASIPAGG